MGISEMVKQSKYTFNDLITEISKCTVLCRFCQTIHTNYTQLAGKKIKSKI